MGSNARAMRDCVPKEAATTSRHRQLASREVMDFARRGLVIANNAPVRGKEGAKNLLIEGSSTCSWGAEGYGMVSYSWVVGEGYTGPT